MSNLNLAQSPARNSSVPRTRLQLVPTRRIYIGEVVASATPMLVQTLLGSCVAVCLRDPVASIGGMNHILLPGRCDGDNRPSRCGVQAMELLINAIMNQGGDRRRLVAKVLVRAMWLPNYNRRRLENGMRSSSATFLPQRGFRWLPNDWVALMRCRSISGRIPARQLSILSTAPGCPAS